MTSSGSSPLIDERRELGQVVPNRIERDPRPAFANGPSPGRIDRAPIRVVVDSRVRIDRAELTPELEEALKAEFTHDNPERKRADALAKVNRWRGPMPPTRITTWRLENAWTRVKSEAPHLSLPRGGLARVVDVLHETGASIADRDDRETDGLYEGCSRPRLSLDPSFVPYAFQTEIVEAVLREETCLIRAAAGSGKTSVGLMLAARLGVPMLAVVPTDLIFEEWVERAGKELGLFGDALGIVKGKTERVRALTIASLKTFAKIATRHARTFGAVLFDEVHKAPCATAFAAIDPLAARYRIGVSDDERRKDGKDFLIYDLFGRVAFEAKREALIEQGVILDTEIRLVPTSFEAPWYVDLPGAARASNEAHDRLLREMAADEERNDVAASLALEEMAAGSPTIVFAHRVEHAARLLSKILAEDHRAGLCVGEEPRQRAATVEKIKAGEWLCGVGTYQSMGTGVNLPAVEAAICVTPIHTNRAFVRQVRGRACRVDRRPGATKRGSRMYVLWDVRVHGAAPLRNFLSWSRGNVKVLVGGRWEDGREHLRRFEEQRDAEAEETAGNDLLGLEG